MKKILLATTVLVTFAGVASADVKLLGSGRFGLEYQQNRFDDINGNGVKDVGEAFTNETLLSTRLRFDIDASTTTDSGVTFGGRIRLQAEQGKTGALLSPAKLYAEANGMHLEVGNVDTAYDSAALMYNSELGFRGNSSGDPQGSYYGFSSGPYAAGNRVGIALTYSVGDLHARISYVTPDQTVTNLPPGVSEEVGVSADYKFGQITVSAAAVQNGGSINKNDMYFVGAEYAVSSAANLGVLYFSEGLTEGNTATVYGNYNFGATTVRAYVANNDAPANKDSTTFGIGADYDLGGATLSGGIWTGYTGNTMGDLGVSFSF